jgi:hypothetical protein
MVKMQRIGQSAAKPLRSFTDYGEGSETKCEWVVDTKITLNTSLKEGLRGTLVPLLKI